MTSSVAIVNWNSGTWLRACIESLLATATRVEILVIDNASDDGSLEAALGFRNQVNFIQNSVNRGFAAAVNQAFQATSGSCVLILNPDIRVMPGAICALEEFMNTHPRAGAVGGYVNEKYLPREFPTLASLIRENLGFGLAPSGRGRRAPGAPVEGEQGIPVDQPAAAALMIRRDAYDEIGGFDEQFHPAWYEDVDFCRRLRAAGWEIYFAPKAEFHHEGGYSAGAMGFEDFTRAYYSNQTRYAHKHLGGAAAAAIRASIAAGMIGRMVARPRNARAYAKVLWGALRGW